MGKVIKDKFLYPYFQDEIVYITLDNVDENEQMYGLNVWDYDEEKLICMLSLDITEDLNDIIGDLSSVCQRYVLEFTNLFGLYSNYKGEDKLERIFKSVDEVQEEIDRRRKANDFTHYFIGSII